MGETPGCKVSNCRYERPFSGERFHLSALDDHATLAALRIHLECFALHFNGRGDRAQDHLGINTQSAIYVDLDRCFMTIFEPGRGCR